MKTRLACTSIYLNDGHRKIIADTMEEEGLTQSEAIRWIIDRYFIITSALNHRGIVVNVYPERVELEFPP